jgi:hypothetical protein
MREQVLLPLCVNAVGQESLPFAVRVQYTVPLILMRGNVLIAHIATGRTDALVRSRRTDATVIVGTLNSPSALKQGSYHLPSPPTAESHVLVRIYRHASGRVDKGQRVVHDVGISIPGLRIARVYRRQACRVGIHD